MTKFKSGESGNPNGRKAGIPNKSTTDVKQVITQILQEDFTPEKIKKDLAKLNERDRLNLFLKLIEYVAPKLKSIENIGVDSDLSSGNLDLSKLSTETLVMMAKDFKKSEKSNNHAK